MMSKYVYVSKDTGLYTLYMLRIFVVFLLSKLFFFKILSGIAPECQTVWIQFRSDVFFRPDLGPNYLQMLSADKEL